MEAFSSIRQASNGWIVHEPNSCTDGGRHATSAEWVFKTKKEAINHAKKLLGELFEEKLKGK